jgi:hypothetical protein
MLQAFFAAYEKEPQVFTPRPTFPIELNMTPNPLINIVSWIADKEMLNQAEKLIVETENTEIEFSFSGGETGGLVQYPADHERVTIEKNRIIFDLSDMELSFINFFLRDMDSAGDIKHVYLSGSYRPFYNTNMERQASPGQQALERAMEAARNRPVFDENAAVPDGYIRLDIRYEQSKLPLNAKLRMLMGQFPKAVYGINHDGTVGDLALRANSWGVFHEISSSMQPDYGVIRLYFEITPDIGEITVTFSAGWGGSDTNARLDLSEAVDGIVNANVVFNSDWTVSSGN